VKTLHVAFSFPPDPPGGTELYVAALCRELQNIGVGAVVAAPGPRDARYRHDGVTVRRFEMQTGQMDLIELYGGGDRSAAEVFDRILRDERPDVVHQHALTPACSIQLVERAKAFGVPVVFTYHTPTTTCQRGTLLEWGTTPCDGRLESHRCTACTLHGYGLGRGTSQTLAYLPPMAGRFIGRARLAGGPWTALRMSSLMEHRLHASRTLFASVDRFVALAPWVEQLLVRNGVPADRITRVPHGIVSQRPPARRRSCMSGRLRLAHLGRVDPIKGTALLLEAMRRAPEASVTLDVIGVVQSGAAAEMLGSWRRRAEGDARIRFLPPIDYDTVIDRLAEYDMVVVPSQGMETGPLVVLEAFAAGVPAIGAALGGIADKIADGVDGLLVRPYQSVEAWSDTLVRVGADRRLVMDLSRGVRPPRSMSDVARDMRAIYESLPARSQVTASTAAAAAASVGVGSH
jgi:glycosyltransferase involved in cell wall biosynthesis